MATPDPDNSKPTATKQITIAAFNRYMRAMDPDSPTSTTFPTTLDASPLATIAQGTHSLEVQDSSPSSPSAITPTPISDPGDLWSEHTTVPTNHRQVMVDFTALLQQLGHDVGHTSTPANDRMTDTVVDRLRIIGDEFDQQLLHTRAWSIISTVVSATADGTIIQQFSCIISTIRRELSLRMIVKVFYFGYRLLSTLGPQNYYREQQWKILSVFGNFIVNELSEWIDQQGGWESILSDEEDTARSYSTSDLPDHELSNPLEEDVTPTDEERRFQPNNEACCSTPPQKHRTFPTKRAESKSVSIPERRSRPTSLRLSLPHTFPRQSSRESPSTTPTSSGLLRDNVLSFGIGVGFGFALFTYFYSK